MPPKTLRSQANQSLSSSVMSSAARPSSSSSNISSKTDHLQLNSNEMNNFDVDTSGLSAESKKVVSWLF